MFEKPVRCDNSGPNCVLVEVAADVVRVRDSKLGDGSPVLAFTHDEWAAFTASIAAGQFAVA